MSLLKPKVPLLSKQEIELNIAEDVLINGLSTYSVLKTEEAHMLINRFKKTMKGLKSFEVPRTIREDLPRRSSDIEEFFGKIPSMTRRDISRIISLYDWASKMDEILDNIKVLQPDIKEKVLSIIKQISAERKTTSVTDTKIERLGFRSKDEIVKSNGYVDIYSGSVTNIVTSSIDSSVSLDISFNRPLYFSNIYSEYSEDSTTSSKVSEKRYDFSQDPLEVVINFSSPNLFNIIEFELGIPFSIKDIESLEDGNFVSVTESVIGTDILVNGETLITTTKESIIDNKSVNKYTIVLPVSSNRLRVTLEIVSSDSYPVKLYQLFNARGEVVRSYTLKESMIIDSRITGPAYSSLREEIIESTRLGELRDANTPSPFRIVEFKNIRVSNIVTRQESVTITKYIQSDLKIRRVEFYVDSYDPLQLIRYKVLWGEDKSTDISPVNSNPVAPTVVNFATDLPREVQLQITIPVNNSYLPTLHGIGILVGEVNI